MLIIRTKYHISALLVMCDMVSTKGINCILPLPIPVLIYMVQARSELKPNRLSHLGEGNSEREKKNDIAVRSKMAKNDL